jgi:hypothetical protein
VIISFLIFSPVTTFLFNSDLAIHVLMTYNFKYPANLYFWGQDRLGSALPMAGHFIYKIFHASPLWAAAIAQYFFLLCGFYFISRLFQYNFTKIIFAITWFLPISCFPELVFLAHPYAIQYCFLGISIFLIENANFLLKKFLFKSIFYILLATLSIFISIWVSDFSWIFFLLLCFVGLSFYLRIFNRGKQGVFIHIPKFSGKSIVVIIFISIGMLVGILFLNYAKNNAVSIKSYDSIFFNSFRETAISASSRLKLIFETIIFKSSNILFSFNALFISLFFILCVIFSFKNKSSKLKSTLWARFFLINTVMGFLLLCSSHWVLLNQLAFRYFNFTIISVWIYALLILEKSPWPQRGILQWILLSASICAAMSSIIPHFFENKKTITQWQARSAFNKLGKIGIVGDYWHSYAIGALDPQNIKATPKEGDDDRCSDCVDSTLACKKIYFVKNGWMDEFPDVILCWGISFKKTGNADTIGELIIAPYVKELADVHRVNMRLLNGNFVRAEMAGQVPSLSANANVGGNWETFLLISLRNNKIALKANNGKFVCSLLNDGGRLVADRDTLKEWETFEKIDIGNRRFALKAFNGKFVCAELDKGYGLFANRDHPGDWETFYFEDK